MIELKGITVGYHSSNAVLRDVELTVADGEFIAIVGPNGVGKTTLMRTLAGMLKPWSGRVILDGRPLGWKSTRAPVDRGLVMVPEGRLLFAPLTVQENLRLGAYSRRDRSARRRTQDEVLELFPELQRMLGNRAGSLSGGQQQMLAIARALMAKPRVILLDEPTIGLAPMVVDRVLDSVVHLNDQQLTVVLAEQNARLAQKVAQRTLVLHAGGGLESPVAGEAQEADLVSAYFGTKAAHSHRNDTGRVRATRATKQINDQAN